MSVDYGSWRGAIDDGNVVCLVKRYIADGSLGQRPLLVLPANRVQSVATLVPRVR